MWIESDVDAFDLPCRLLRLRRARQVGVVSVVFLVDMAVVERSIRNVGVKSQSGPLKGLGHRIRYCSIPNTLFARHTK